MSHAHEIEHVENDRRELDLLAAQRRKNLITLAVLALIVITMVVLSQPLFNNFWDPSLSAETISH